GPEVTIECASSVAYDLLRELGDGRTVARFTVHEPGLDAAFRRAIGTDGSETQIPEEGEAA
ncbi:MAG: hypothetical protein ABEH35_07125, partial [Haloarculaceae archaeon]